MKTRLQQDLQAFAPAFDMDDDINGADCVEWLGEARTEALRLLVRIGKEEK